MTTHLYRGDGFTRCGERIDDQTKFGGGCYYCNIALGQRAACECGSRYAYWAGDTMRNYACAECHAKRDP